MRTSFLVVDDVLKSLKDLRQRNGRDLTRRENLTPSHPILPLFFVNCKLFVDGWISFRSPKVPGRRKSPRNKGSALRSDTSSSSHLSPRGSERDVNLSSSTPRLRSPVTCSRQSCHICLFGLIFSAENDLDVSTYSGIHLAAQNGCFHEK